MHQEIILENTPLPPRSRIWRSDPLVAMTRPPSPSRLLRVPTRSTLAVTSTNSRSPRFNRRAGRCGSLPCQEKVTDQEIEIPIVVDVAGRSTLHIPTFESVDQPFGAVEIASVIEQESWWHFGERKIDIRLTIRLEVSREGAEGRPKSVSKMVNGKTSIHSTPRSGSKGCHEPP